MLKQLEATFENAIALHKLVNSIDLCEYLPIKAKTIEDEKKYLDEMNSDIHKMIHWIYKDDELVWVITVESSYLLWDTPVAELGVWTTVRWTANQSMKEIEQILKNLWIKRIECIVDIENSNCIKMLNKLWYTRDMEIKWYRTVCEKSRDVYLYYKHI